ncbi:MAG: glycosyltransferase family 1 protein [Anaerolineae bacterium]
MNLHRPLHVGLNAHLLSGERSYRSAGVHQYVRHLLRHLPEAGCRVTAFLGRDCLQPVGGCAVRCSHLPTGRPYARVIWEQFVQPYALCRERVDLAHAPVFVAPLAASCPLVVTIHDLSFLRLPHVFHPAKRLYLNVFTRASVRRAQRIIAVSTHAAEETARLLGVQRGRVDVICHGVDSEFHPRSPEEVRAFRERRGLPERFLLFVGTLEPRKNLVRLVEAFARLREPGLKLVLAGGRGWSYEEILARVEDLELEEEVVLPGFIPGDELPLWYNAATLLVYPSLYEGFGMPILESLASGTVVLTSDRSSLPEAAGDGALLVDPYDVDAIAEGMHQLLTDELLRRELRRRGMIHAARFSWAQMAIETVGVYRRALSGEDRG